MQGMTLRKYGVQTTINFELFEIDGIDFRLDAVHAAGDLKIMKDEAVEGNTTNGFVDEGQGYSVVLSATEMQAARIVLYLVDQTGPKVWLDKSIVIETYGNASAMHAFDLDTALQDVNIESSDDIDLTATQKVSVSEAVDDIRGAGFIEATDSLEAIRDRGDAAWTGSSAGVDRLLMIDTTIATLAGQTSFTLTNGSSDDNAYENSTIIIENAGTSEQKAFGVVSDYVGSTKTITLKYDPAIFIMAVADKIYILAENGLKTSLPNRQISVETDGDLTKVNLCDVNTDMRGTDNSNTVEPDPAGTAPTAIENRQEMDSNSTSLASILADTNELQADDLPALIAALNSLSSSDILTTALTESYAADGSTATLSQLLYMIWSMMNSLGFVLTTGTSRKLDGTTEAMTFTIDDRDNPTDINRET